jgi:hypothetical protein
MPSSPAAFAPPGSFADFTARESLTIKTLMEVAVYAKTICP